MGKLFITIGILFIIIGILMVFGIKLFKLPGDIYIEKDNFSFYFPISTSILLRAPLIIGNTHNGLCRCKIVQEIYES